MLQFTDRHTGEKIWINPRQVSAVVNLKQSEGVGCSLMMAGGFEIQIQETADEIAAQINKRLNAY